MLIASPATVVLAPGATASVVLTDTLNSPLTVPTLPTGSVNNAPMFSTSVPTTDLVWPISVNVTASAVAAGGGQATFTFTDSTGTVQTAVVTIAVVPIVANVPNGRTSTAAIATVRRRTNLVFGEPSDSDILAMLNDGLEQFTTDAEPILSSTSIPITSLGTNILAFPPDVERPRDANYSTGVISSPGTIVYPMDQRDYDEFVLETDQSPVGGIGGIPTIYTLIQDTSGVQLIQFYVYANSGYVNLHYYKRPNLWALPTVAVPNSYTDLDSAYQECAILYACMQACENREDYATGAAYFGKLLNAKVEESKLTVKRRARKPGPTYVNDVMTLDTVIPNWMR